MARHYDDLPNSTVKTRRQQEDQRRMEFRRAIESYCEARQLNQDLCDYIDGMTGNHWQASQLSGDARRNARQAG
ncbi:PA3496 family putative envelope integrity protein [Pseudomonas sp. NPDC089734]|uniref:PA3496 family putative envelope integrity protein n=1 Tax=Pseudomonas sp. NPDC089734 TaxID=3364469 RepID=UPI0038124286